MMASSLPAIDLQELGLTGEAALSWRFFRLEDGNPLPSPGPVRGPNGTRTHTLRSATVMRDSSPDLGIPVDDSAVDRFARPLALPATGREVAQFVALRAAACVGAAYSNLALRTGRSLRVFHGTFLDPEIADRYNDVPLDAPYPLSAAARENRLVLLP